MAASLRKISPCTVGSPSSQWPPSTPRQRVFASRAITNLGVDLQDWRRWLAQQGPILARLNVDRTWDRARATKGRLDVYQSNTARGGHAVSIVGYTPDHFIVRNSWGTSWGDRGFASASNDYAQTAFTEAYGAVL